MNNQKIVNELNKDLSSILEYDGIDLRRPQWGAANFEGIKAHLDELFSITKEVQAGPIEKLPSFAIRELSSHLPKLIEIIKSIDEFSVDKHPDPIKVRDQIRNSIVQSIQQVNKAFTNWLPYLYMCTGKHMLDIKAIRDSGEEVKLLKQQVTSEYKKFKEQTDEALRAVSIATQEIGAAVQSKHYSEEAKQRYSQAINWLKLTKWLAIVTVLIATVPWFIRIAPIDEDGFIWRSIAGRVLPISLMITVTIWSSRIYKALMHQRTISIYKALSVQTVEVFTASTRDEQTRGAILKEATQSIFQEPQTGFLDHKRIKAESEMKLLDIIRSAIYRE